MFSVKPIRILLVEDSPSDADLILEALEENQINNTIHIVRNGEEAMAFLKKEGQWNEAPIPDLIFLDLNLPCKDGREVLQEIKTNSDLGMIPVVVMTSSSSERDISICYSLHASSYIVKPLNIDEFFDVMKIFCDYWCRVVKLPSLEGSRSKINRHPETGSCSLTL